MGKVAFSYDIPLPKEPNEDVFDPLLSPTSKDRKDFEEVESPPGGQRKGRPTNYKQKNTSPTINPSYPSTGPPVDFNLGTLPRFNIKEPPSSPSPPSGYYNGIPRSYSRDSMDFEDSRGESPRPSSWNERVGFKSTARRLVRAHTGFEDPIEGDSPRGGGNGIHGGVLYNLLRLYSAAQPPPSLESNFASSNTDDPTSLSRVQSSSQSSTDTSTENLPRANHTRPGLGGRTESSKSDIPTRGRPISINPFRPSHRVARSLDMGREEKYHPIYGKIGPLGSTETIIGDVPPPSFDVASTRKPLFNPLNRSESSLFKLKFSEEARSKEKREKKERKKAEYELRHSITLHVTDILIRQDFVIKLGRALMRSGGPPHRIESHLATTASVLDINAGFIFLPGMLLITFGDQDTRTSEVRIIKESGDLDLGRLDKIQNVYKAVVNDKVSAQEGAAELRRIIQSPDDLPPWTRPISGFLIGAFVCGFAFSGSPLDLIAAGFLAALVTFLQFTVSIKSPLFANVFEIVAAALCSLIGRGLARSGYFCYQSIAASGIVALLPGYTILIAILEIGSKSILSGCVRLVFSLVYSLFLGYGIAIGSDIYGLLDPKYITLVQESNSALQQITGSFVASNISAITPFAGNGTWTYLPAASETLITTIYCNRPTSTVWYLQSLTVQSQLWLVLFVPLFSIAISIFNKATINSSTLGVMTIITSIGYGVNYAIGHLAPNLNDNGIVGGFVIGLLGNLYSRVFRGNGFVVMTSGIFCLVPGSFAIAGALSDTGVAPGLGLGVFGVGAVIALRMFSVAISLSTGLFISALVVYPFGKSKPDGTNFLFAF